MVILIYIIYKRGLILYALLFGLISKQFKPVLISTGLNCLEIRLDSSARQREILTIRYCVRFLFSLQLHPVFLFPAQRHGGDHKRFSVSDDDYKRQLGF